MPLDMRQGGSKRGSCAGVDVAFLFGRQLHVIQLRNEVAPVCGPSIGMRCQMASAETAVQSQPAGRFQPVSYTHLTLPTKA